MKGRVTIEGRDFGEIEVAASPFVNAHCGFAFFCPDCGRVWAEIRIDGWKMFPASIPCREHHRELYAPGGSIWMSYWPHITDAFNREILEYETLRHLEIYDQHKSTFA